MLAERYMVDATLDIDRELMEETEAALVLAESYVVDSPESLQAAAYEINAVQKRLRLLVEQRRRITQPIDESKRAVMDLFRPAIEACEAAKRFYQRGIDGYQRVQAERKREAEREARARQEAEQARLREEARAEAEAGHIFQADELMQAAELLPAEPSDDGAFCAHGLAVGERWTVEVTDLMALVKAVAEGKAPLGAVQANMPVLREHVRSMKAALDWPGLRVTREMTSRPTGRL